jgi:hypothetical protein
VIADKLPTGSSCRTPGEQDEGAAPPPHVIVRKSAPSSGSHGKHRHLFVAFDDGLVHAV